VEGAWYAQRGSKIRELYTMLHLPYTSMVLSYVLIGAVLSPIFFLSRVTLTVLAYFLGLGISAHALNELNARHWGTTLSKKDLQIVFTLPLIAALSIGVYGLSVLYTVSSGNLVPPTVLLTFILLETFFLFAYNLNFQKGRFHNDIAFAVSWGLFPFLTSYYVNSLTLSISSVLVGLSVAATAMIEINLSRWCKNFRRKSNVAEIRFEDGTFLKLSTLGLISNPEKALKLIVFTVDLLGIGLLIRRLIG
jgi:hypothetical protein